MSQPYPTPPVRLSHADAARFAPFSFAALSRALREGYADRDAVAQLLEEKTAAASDRETLARVAEFWKAMHDDASGEDDPAVAALDRLAELEPVQDAAAQRRPWLRAFVNALLRRYSDPQEALRAMDVLHAVLGYPEELTPLTTYRNDPGVPVDLAVSRPELSAGITSIAAERNKAMRRFVLTDQG